MPDDEWVKTRDDGKKVKFTYQELPENGAFISAQVAGNEIVYSIVIVKATKPLCRGDVEIRFEAEISKIASSLATPEAAPAASPKAAAPALAEHIAPPPSATTSAVAPPPPAPHRPP